MGERPEWHAEEAEAEGRHVIYCRNSDGYGHDIGVVFNKEDADTILNAVNALAATHEEVERLRDALSGLVAAVEHLNFGKSFALDRARAALQQGGGDAE